MAETSRRDFLKALGLFGAGAGLAAAGVEAAPAVIHNVERANESPEKAQARAQIVADLKKLETFRGDRDWSSVLENPQALRMLENVLQYHVGALTSVEWFLEGTDVDALPQVSYKSFELTGMTDLSSEVAQYPQFKT